MNVFKKYIFISVVVLLLGCGGVKSVFAAVRSGTTLPLVDIANITDIAISLSDVTSSATVMVNVAVPKLPDNGTNPNTLNITIIIWEVLGGILVALVVVLFLIRKSKWKK